MFFDWEDSPVWAGIKTILAIIIFIVCIKYLENYCKEMDTLKAQKTTEITELASLELTSNIEGEFFRLGRGHVGETEYYITYRVFDDGGKQLWKIDANEAVIYETLKPGETAYVERIINGLGTVEKTSIFVPDGTIVQEYDFTLN